jgi:hypothetical protein
VAGSQRLGTEGDGTISYDFRCLKHYRLSNRLSRRSHSVKSTQTQMILPHEVSGMLEILARWIHHSRWPNSKNDSRKSVLSPHEDLDTPKTIAFGTASLSGTTDQIGFESR